MKELIAFFTLDPSDPVVFIAQLIGFISLAGSLFTCALTKRKHILLVKLICDLSASINLLMLGAIVGGAICGINTVRSVVFYYKGQKKFASHVLIPIAFIVITIGCSLLDWNGLYSLLPSIGSVFAIIGFWQKDPRVIKLFNLPCVTLWLIYNVLSGSIANSIANAISIATIIVSLTISLVDYFKRGRVGSETPTIN